MNVNDPLLVSELRRDEGVRYAPYKDPLGVLTVGVGHNLKARPLPNATYPLTDAQVDQLLSEDLIDVFAGMHEHLPWWTTLTQARQRVLLNMAFNLGVAGLLAFKNTLDAIQKSHFELASVNMRNSRWASQVGARATRLAKMMIEG